MREKWGNGILICRNSKNQYAPLMMTHLFVLMWQFSLVPNLIKKVANSAASIFGASLPLVLVECLVLGKYTYSDFMNTHGYLFGFFRRCELSGKESEHFHIIFFFFFLMNTFQNEFLFGSSVFLTKILPKRVSLWVSKAFSVSFF